jgi:spore coat-associated protein N
VSCGRRILLPLLILAVALVAVHPVLAAAGGSDGSVAAGRVGSGPVFDLGNLAPGDNASGSVRIANTGSAAGTFVLSAEVSGDSKLASSLVLTVVDDTGRTAYRGSLAGLAGEALGTFAPAEAHTYQLSVALPSSAGNELQGLSAGASFAWSAVSA